MSTKAQNSDIRKELKSLIDENKRLREENINLKSSESFVGIESLVVAPVWLPAPESRSGDPRDRERGRMLKGVGDLAIIPSYWVTDYIANRNASFLIGDIRINNDLARRINPNINIVDLVAPDDFVKNVVLQQDILALLEKGDKAVLDYVKKHKADLFILNRVLAVIEMQGDEYADDSPEKAQVESISAYVSDIIGKLTTPKEEEESIPKRPVE